MFKNGINDLFKKAQDIQADIEKVKDELADSQLTGESGGGLVKIIMNGRYDTLGVTIDPSVLKEDHNVLEDLIAAGINDGVQKVKDHSVAHIKKVTEGLELPGGLKLPIQ